MRLFFALITFVILTACSSQPQVTVTPFAEVTVTLPPPTLTATPTLAPTVTPTPEPTTYTPENWGSMSPEQKLAAVPASPEYTAGNVSTLEGKENYVILRSTDPDKKDEATGAWNAFTGKVETMSDAGIKIFKLTDGVSELEMRSFKTVEAYREYLMNDPNLLWMQGDYTARDQATATFFLNPTPKSESFFPKFRMIPGYNTQKWLGDTMSGDGSHLGEGEFIPLFMFDIGEGCTVETKNLDNNISASYVEVSFAELKAIGQ